MKTLKERVELLKDKLAKSQHHLVIRFEEDWSKPGLDPVNFFVARLSDDELRTLIDHCGDRLASVVGWLSDDRVARVVGWLSDDRVARVVELLSDDRVARICDAMGVEK